MIIKAAEGYFEVVEMFTAEIVLMVSGVCMYLQTHRVIYIKYVQICVCQAHLEKEVLKKIMKSGWDELHV